MRPMKRLMQLDEAIGLALARARAIEGKESIGIMEASGRVAAEDVVSRISVPPFSRSAMDGYAVRASDTYGAARLKPKKLRRIETVYAGSVPKKGLKRGDCCEIATGAMIPKGADAVLMVEDTESEGNMILAYSSVHPGQNISKKGEDIAPGTKLISKGEVLNPSKVGALAAIGEESVAVYEKPLVAIVPTGNEIAPLGVPLGPGQVYNINTYTLAAVVAANGCEVHTTGIVGDTVRELSAVVKANSDCDVLVFSGGSSVGERDVMLDVLEKGGEVVFHGVAMKPGKPTLFGVIGDQLLFGMPGYPTACLSNAYIILAPVLRKMARLKVQRERTIEATMARRVVSTTGRTQFMSVRLVNGKAEPAFKESGAITSMAFADGYIVIPAEVDLVEKDERVTVYLL